MATATDELTYVHFPIAKWDKTDDGDLVVYGKATDGSLDSDDQVVDPSWSAKALSDWHGKTGGNVRVQHQALRDPAGKSLSIEIDKDGDSGHWVKSLIVEPVAKRLVEKGILTAYSVGIARPVVHRDPTGKARGEIVAGGHLAEISLVDRPANKACGFVLGKSDKNGDLELTGELVGDEDFLAKFRADEDLLVKQGSGDPGTGDGDATADESDGSEDTEGGSGSTSDDSEGAGYADDNEDDDSDGDDAVSKADGTTRLAYKAARADWLQQEPSVKGIAGGTEYLAKRADWMKWHSHGEAEGLSGTREAAEMWLAKRDFSADQRHDAASSGAAMPDGSFPIKNGEDLGNAVHLAGHAKNPDAARAHIRRRARALGMSDKIPDTWDKVDIAAPASLAEFAAAVAKSMLGDDRYTELAKAASTDGTVGDNSSSFAAGKKPCPTCHGDGKIMGNNRACPDCSGTGKVPASGKSEADIAGDSAPVTKDDDEAAGDSTLSVGSEVEQADVAKGSKNCKGCGKSYDADTGFKYCQNCGKKLPSANKRAKRADREARIADLAATVLKSVEAGLITAQAGDEIIAEAVAALEKKRPLPPDVHQGGQHREPDGTSTVERLEPEAGLGTDPDPTSDRVPESVSSLGSNARPSDPAGVSRPPSNQKGDDDTAVPYTAGRMHDLMCAAYNPADTLAGYPSLKSLAEAVDEGWFLEQATAAMKAGKTRKAARLGTMVDAARTVKEADPSALLDASLLLHKSFTDLYPNLHISPGNAPKPGSYQRPYLTAGHASETASDNGSSHIPPSAHTPEPEDFHRPLITDGHEAESPANKDDGTSRSGPPGDGAATSTSGDFPRTTGAARTYYSNAQRDSARAALQSMHDHIAGAFPDLCPMAASKSVMPPDMGASNVPSPHTPPHQGGVSTVGKQQVPLTAPASVQGPELQQAIADAIRRHTARTGQVITLPDVGPAPAMSRKQIQKAARRMGLDLIERATPLAETGAVTIPSPPAPTGISLAEMKALLAEQINPLVEQHTTELGELRKQIDEIGARPDPAMAPVRGALAKAPDVAVPVERRSLIDEAADRTNKSAAANEARYRQYVEALTRSPDPGVREAAMATIDKLSAGM